LGQSGRCPLGKFRHNRLMLKNTFCSSPWFHIRLTYDGSFIPCRWAPEDGEFGKDNYKTTSIMQFYNGEQMREMRTQMLAGQQPSKCAECYYQDQHDKVSGRIKQLNKSGISLDHFDLSLRSSPHYPNFKYSHDNDGISDYSPVDLQIDLGNTCNSACIMCYPEASSRLSQDYKKLSKINNTLFQAPSDYVSWTRDPALLDKFIDELLQIRNLRYIHFLGGETLYDPAFYTLCEKLIAAGISKKIIIGTTTNGTIYDKRVESIIAQFKEFHLGVSIDSVTGLNDYIRYPSNVDSVLANIDKFLKLRDSTNLYITLRITPNIFTIYDIHNLFEYMIEKSVTAESCNILTRPEHLKIELLPEDIRKEVIENLSLLVKKYDLEKTNLVNIRRPDLISEVNANLIIEYKQFLETYQAPDNLEKLRSELVDFIKAFETLRGNNILDHAPRYEKFLRHYGY
jgi:MoaA/NifB/PqqE/SkfB family radical SAM enzyme